VSIFGTAAAQSIANLMPAEQAKAQDRLKRAAAEKYTQRRTRPERPDEVVIHTENTDAVRDLKDYSEEEAREDRLASYTPDGARTGTGEEHSLDING
jgi:hypothetical protein